MLPFAPGSRVVIRDEEWLVRRIDPADDGGWLLTCDGVSELVRSQSALFLTVLEDEITVLEPEKTELVPDDTPAYSASRARASSLPTPSLRRAAPPGCSTAPSSARPSATTPCPAAPASSPGSHTAPFTRANREADYRMAWAFFG